MRIDTKEIVVRDAITIDREKSVRSAVSFMNYFKVDSLIVTEGDYPVGMFTAKDVPTSEQEMTKVGDVMSEPLKWVRYNTTLSEVAEIMEYEQVGRLPIFGNLSSGPILLGVYVHKAKPVENELELES
jgi:CBS domain-containing protein